MTEKDYSDSYSDKKFWNKINKMPETAGCSILRAAFTLYVLLKTKSTPLWAKSLCIFAAGWLIAPIDGGFPDFTPVIGYLDDLAIMTLVIGQLYAFIDADIQKKVDEMLPKRCRGVYIEPTYK